jgi:hypothetical protein
MVRIWYRNRSRNRSRNQNRNNSISKVETESARNHYGSTTLYSCIGSFFDNRKQMPITRSVADPHYGC